jgi:hypothetical protein
VSFNQDLRSELDAFFHSLRVKQSIDPWNRKYRYVNCENYTGVADGAGTFLDGYGLSVQLDCPYSRSERKIQLSIGFDRLDVDDGETSMDTFNSDLMRWRSVLETINKGDRVRISKDFVFSPM